VRQGICATRFSSLQGFQNGARHFCSLKLTKLCMKLGLSSILVRKLVKFARGVLNKYPTLWLTGATIPTHMSCTPLGGLNTSITQHTHPTKSFKFGIFIHSLVNFQATKMADPIMESKTQSCKTICIKSALERVAYAIVKQSSLRCSH
jgi:hypothetical protein